MKRKRLPSPAMVIALLALFVALSGTAVAAGVATGVVPLAKRALVADNAKKLNGKTAVQIATAAAAAVPGLVSVTSQSWSLNANSANDFTVACASGQKAIAGGYDNPAGNALALDTRPSSDQTSWKVFLVNLSSSAAASGSVFAVCLA
jgi:hypothetical protein